MPLALLGGAPAFPEKLHVGRPNLGPRERFSARVDGIYERRWLSNLGSCVQEFEARLKEVVGTRHCIPICNATVALEIAVRGVGLSGEVIVPSFTFIATAHALRWMGMTPVFADIDPVTHNLDVASVERLITPRTTGILGVHLWGRACPVEALDALAQKHNLRVMYDAAHAFGCSHGGRMIGNFGSCEVFSFHATKFLNSGEGGAIATNDDELAARIRLMKNFGFAGLDQVVHLGTNGKMNELSAALGLTNLEAVDEFVAVNRRNYEAYREGLRGCPGVQMVEYAGAEQNNLQYVVLEVDGDEAGLTRDEVLAVLRAEGVLARRYFYPGCHEMQPYRDERPAGGWHLPATERLCQRILILPTGTAVGAPEIATICQLIRTALAESAAVRQQLAAA